MRKKEIIVTGCCGQLGKKIVCSLIDNGYFVIGVDIEKKCSIKKIEDFCYYNLDITSENLVKSFFLHLKKIKKNLYGLINNAGVAVFTPFENRTYEELMYVTKVNLFGPIFMSQNFCKIISKSANASIVNISSIYGIVAPDQSLYSDTPRNSSEIYGMTKAALLNFTKYLSVYLSKNNIRCNSISPGGIYFQQGPEFIENYSKKVPLKRMAKVEEMTGAINFLIDHKISSYVNGANIQVDGGFTSW